MVTVQERDVAVIGAGAAGLAAALRLTHAGARVTVYERDGRAGGRMRTETLDGARVDVGVQLVSSSHTSLFETAQLSGSRDLLRKSPGRDALWRKGRANPITYGSVASMVASSALPTTLKIRMGSRYLPFLTARARGLDANDPAGSGGIAYDDESIGAWGRRELGDDFVDYLVYPLLAAYYGALPEQTSAGVYHALARMGMDVSVYAAAGGFGALADAWLSAAESAGARYAAGTEVTRVDASADGVRLETSAGEARHDAAVIAVPAPVVARLLDTGGEVSEWLARVRVSPTLTVAFRMDRPFPGDYFGLSFPRGGIGDRVVALCIQGRKLPGLVPAGGDALVALPAPGATAALMAMDDDAAADATLSVLERAVGGISSRVRSAHVYRYEHGYTIFEPGYLRHLSHFDTAWLPPRVALAGDYMLAPSVEGAVRSGEIAARQVNGMGEG
ncbi:MAG: FAD-dependent oxidoreductase [Gemmatimonadetes bacterium]|nr:FAD-dependent oxidoreductase [Gemmatimonadota bacterium]